MCRYLQLESYSLGHVLFRQGEYGDKYYIILQGQVSVHINITNDKTGKVVEKEVSRLSKGISFGDLALLFNSIRNATIKLVEQSDFIVLTKEIFQKYIKYKTASNAHEILQFYEAHVFAEYKLDLPQKIQILSKSEQSNFISNSVVISQG